MYRFRANLVKVVDADTVDLYVDLGFNIFMEQRVRLLNIDAPERFTKRGKELTQFVKDWFEFNGDQIILSSEKLDSFGRSLGIIYTACDNHSLNDRLLSEEGVKVYKR